MVEQYLPELPPGVGVPSLTVGVVVGGVTVEVTAAGSSMHTIGDMLASPTLTASSESETAEETALY